MARFLPTAALSLVALLVLPAGAAALEYKLLSSDGDISENLGASVAVDGDTAVVGAPRENNDRGAVYVFTRQGDSWVQAAKLTASDNADGDSLGRSVAIEGDTIVAGAPGDDFGTSSGRGSVYTFARTGGNRFQTAKLVASDGAADDLLGTSVAIDGNTIVAGAQLDDVGGYTNQGSAYTFARTGGQRAETAKLTASDGPDGDAVDQFGSSVAIDGNTIVAGAPYADLAGDFGQGAAYTFARTGGDRNQTARLTASDGAAYDSLGFSVAIEGDTIVAGASSDDVGGDPDRGSAYTFARSGGNRTQTAKLTASDGAGDEKLGQSVAIDGDTIVAAAPFDDLGADANQGSAYTFARTGGNRTQTAKLTVSDGAEDDQFGRSVAIEGDTIVAGAPNDDVSADADQGSAWVFFPATPSAPGPPAPSINDGTSNTLVPDVTVPRIARFRLTRRRFAVGRGRTPISARARRGTRLRFSLSENATMRISVQRALRGRRAGRSCVKPRRRLRQWRRCTRWRRAGRTLVRKLDAGWRTVRFSGRIGRRALRRGRYRFRLTATDAAGNRSRAVYRRFRIDQVRRATRPRTAGSNK
jgi:FG-GAP repeat